MNTKTLWSDFHGKQINFDRQSFFLKVNCHYRESCNLDNLQKFHRYRYQRTPNTDFVVKIWLCWVSGKYLYSVKSTILKMTFTMLLWCLMVVSCTCPRLFPLWIREFICLCPNIFWILIWFVRMHSSCKSIVFHCVFVCVLYFSLEYVVWNKEIIVSF